MNRDVHPMNLNETEYVIALNTNIEDESGNGYPMLQNEHSNLLCNRFTGYYVVGIKHDLNEDKTYYFLTNPTTNVSEIGYISAIHTINNVEDVEVNCGCDFKNILDTPLEEQEQTETCTYTTIIDDACNNCLNFSIDYPLKTIEIKDEKCGKRLYWTDNYNPQRYIDLSNLDYYKYTGEAACGEDPISTCLDCEKLRIFPLFEKPCITPDVIQFGGNLRAGTYEFLVAYCDKYGNEISQYFSITNPVSIFDPNNNILDATQLDYRTNFGIKLNVTGLDKQYGYYKVAVIQNADVNGVVSYFEEGVHPIIDDTIFYVTDADKKRTTLNKLLAVKPIYTHAEGMTSSNGYLFQYGLKAQKELNLQPVVNLMGAFLRWQTVVADEDLYKDGINSSLYRSYLRDEVYPFSIRFITSDGFETALFPLVNRPFEGTENDEVETNTDIESINSFAPNCSDIGRTKNWQFYNTASSLGLCQNFDGEIDTIIKDLQRICTIDGVETIPSSTLTLQLDEPYTNLEDYINEHREEICDNTSPYYNAFLCGYLSDLYEGSDCAPNFGDNCDAPVLIDEEVFVQEVVNENSTLVEKDLADYIRALPPQFCDMYEINISTGGLLRDTFFERHWMTAAYTAMPSPTWTFQTVYDRKNAGTNTDCNYPKELFYITNPTTATGLPIHLDYYGGDTIASLQLTQDSSCTNANFTSKLHIGALWFIGEFGDREKILLEFSKRTTCTASDDIPIGTELRINVYENCSSTTPIYCEIVDVNVGTLLELEASMFTGDTFYVTIDAPITTESGTFYDDDGSDTTPKVRYRTAPVCGCFSLYLREIEYTEVEVTYDEIILGKRQTYEASCTFDVPQYDGCNPIPFEYGKFGYWESLETYPDNEELYNSKALLIEETDIPVSYKAEFESYFVDTINNGEYTLKDETDFRCKPIRHYKFPDSELAPFMDTSLVSPFQRSLIYPIGVTIDNELINAFLDIAVKQQLITAIERNKIVKYEIFRGDRVLNRSIIAKGLIYDTYKYSEQGEPVYYPNYPYNDLGSDKLNFYDTSRTTLVPHPFSGLSNNRFTFHSPDTHFNRPTIPNEVNIEGYQFGSSKGRFIDVEDHSTWVILGQDSYTTATVLAIAEVALEAAIKVGELLVQAQSSNWFITIGGTSTGFGSGYAGVGLGTGLATALGVTMVIDAFMRVGRYRYEWLKIFRDNGRAKNFASYYTSVGMYNRFLPNTDIGNKLRGLATTRYVKAGRHPIVEENTGVDILLNNIDRESSVYLSFGDAYNFVYDSEYANYDNGNVDGNTNSRTTSSDSFSCASGRSREIERNIASPYISLKNYMPSQYGTIDSIKWLPTGYCGDLSINTDCNSIFGGDTFISRFSLKRKLPLFLVNVVGDAPLIPFEYLPYSNIASARYYCNYDITGETTVVGSLFPEIRSEYNFDCLTGSNRFYVKPPSKFYLYYYGIPQFLVESDINCNYRYARKERHENFYPNEADYEDWTQEVNVSIKKDNEYNYNFGYSRNTTPVASRTLPSNYSKELYECLYDSPNGVIYSLQDSSEQDINDPWLIYRPLDFYQFPTSAGKLIDLKGIESAQILGRFENQAILFNAIDTLRERQSVETFELGSGGIFATRPLEWKRTDLGYAGTQHKAMVSCEFGHFWVDSKRGQVFQVDQNGKNLKEITAGLRNWFKEQLPFKILKTNNENLTYEDLDNHYKGIGITMGWDSRYKRVFLTKKDYIAKKPIFTLCNQIFSTEERDLIIEFNQNLGYTYEGYSNCKLKFSIDNEGEIDYTEIPMTPLYFNNTEFFEDVSFTVAYNPLLESWISYYSFKPDYYVNYHNYFQTGLNFSVDSSEKGLWSHLLTNKSYQVFYGKKYEWMIELPNKEGYINKIMKTVEYWLDTRRYHNEYDYAEKRDLGFNKAWIYNNSNNSGQLNLITELKNNQMQKLQYPVKNGNAMDILATEYDKKWTFNQFYNQVRNETNNIPIWLYDKNALNKSLNMKALQYNQVWKDRLRGDWFLIRLQQDKESRFKFIFKWMNSKELMYQ